MSEREFKNRARAMSPEERAEDLTVRATQTEDSVVLRFSQSPRNPLFVPADERRERVSRRKEETGKVMQRNASHLFDTAT